MIGRSTFFFLNIKQKKSLLHDFPSMPIDFSETKRSTTIEMHWRIEIFIDKSAESTSMIGRLVSIKKKKKKNCQSSSPQTNLVQYFILDSNMILQGSTKDENLIDIDKLAAPVKTIEVRWSFFSQWKSMNFLLLGQMETRSSVSQNQRFS